MTSDLRSGHTVQQEEKLEESTGTEILKGG